MLLSMVVYMSSMFWLLPVKSSDLSQAEEEITACKSELSHKMTTIVTQNVDHNDYDEDVTFSSYLCIWPSVTKAKI